MGKPSDQRRSAQRPGKRERARVKKHRRGMMSSHRGTVGGAVHYALYAGRKKWQKVQHYLDRLATDASIGDSLTPKSVTKGKRPLYTFEVAVHTPNTQHSGFRDE
jgi:hypothetical protein